MSKHGFNQLLRLGAGPSHQRAEDAIISIAGDDEAGDDHDYDIDDSTPISSSESASARFHRLKPKPIQKSQQIPIPIPQRQLIIKPSSSSNSNNNSLILASATSSSSSQYAESPPRSNSSSLQLSLAPSTINPYYLKSLDFTNSLLISKEKEDFKIQAKPSAESYLTVGANLHKNQQQQQQRKQQQQITPYVPVRPNVKEEIMQKYYCCICLGILVRPVTSNCNRREGDKNKAGHTMCFTCMESVSDSYSRKRFMLEDEEGWVGSGGVLSTIYGMVCGGGGEEVKTLYVCPLCTTCIKVTPVRCYQFEDIIEDSVSSGMFGFDAADVDDYYDRKGALVRRDENEKSRKKKKNSSDDERNENKWTLKKKLTVTAVAGGGVVGVYGLIKGWNLNSSLNSKGWNWGGGSEGASSRW